MSNVIKRLLCADAALVLFTVLFKMLHWPGGDLLVLISICLSAILLLCAAFCSRPINALRVLFCLEGIILLVGTTFKFFHWPGGSLIFFIAAILGIILLLYTAIFHKFDK